MIGNFDFGTSELTLHKPLVTRGNPGPAGVKRRSCRSTQVNKTQVKSCGPKLVAMGLRVSGLQPIDVGSESVQRSPSQIIKMPT